MKRPTCMNTYLIKILFVVATTVTSFNTYLFLVHLILFKIFDPLKVFKIIDVLQRPFTFLVSALNIVLNPPY
jgi:hypothetical protein